MSPLLWAIVFAGTCWVAALGIAFACILAFIREDEAWEAHYRQQVER